MLFSSPLKILHNAEEHPQFPDVLSSPIPNAFEADCWIYSGKFGYTMIDGSGKPLFCIENWGLGYAFTSPFWKISF